MWAQFGVVCLLVAVPCLSEAQLKNPFDEVVKRNFYKERLEHCFCELTGQVAECCCDVETVETLNRDKIYPLISKLVEYTYFKFFRVNLHRSCPFWPNDGRCVLKDCQVEECSEDELPNFLREDTNLKGDQVSGSHVIQSCDPLSAEEEQLSNIDRTISIEQEEDFRLWEEHDHAGDSFCQPEDESSSGSSFVDLTLNPEQYTGYSGHSAERIWKAIYHENCFRPEATSDEQSNVPIFHHSLLQDMCLEKRAFFRLISGLHTSINTHLSAKFLSGSVDNPQFKPNLNEFVRRFDSETTNGQGPWWLKNLYFTYLLVLRAVTKADAHWQEYQFYTGCPAEDRQVGDTVAKIVQASRSCPSLFDETMMFTGNTSEELKKEFKSHFKNISLIMNCVGCSKCKLWGKLQIQGIGTALKVLFTPPRNGRPLQLSRTETVALFNVLAQLSSSIHYLEMFRQMEGNATPTSRQATRSHDKEL